MTGRGRPRAVPVVSHNLNGQRLGRKGRDTRDRIISATQEILAEPPGELITLSEVARRAGLRMGTLYLYFADLTELVIAVLEPVMATAEDEYVHLLREWWPDAELGARATAFVKAYYGFWEKHSRVLHLRNSMADRFDQRIMVQRVKSTQPLLGFITRQIVADETKIGPEVMSMATALMTGLERVATVMTDTNLPTMLQSPFAHRLDHLLRAEARLIELGIRDYRQQLTTD